MRLQLHRVLPSFEQRECRADGAHPLELERLAAGVAYRVIYAEEVLQVPGRWHDLEAGIAAGEQARVAPHLPVKLTLFDDFAATLPMADVSPPGGAGGATGGGGAAAR